MSTKASQIISKLAAGIDLDKILKDHCLTFERAHEILNTPLARRQIAARRKLAVIHARLVAHRFSSYAVHRLCELLSDDKADLRFKGAVAVLNIVGLSRFKQLMAKRIKPSVENPQDAVSSETTAEDAELLECLASVVASKRSGIPKAPKAPEVPKAS